MSQNLYHAYVQQERGDINIIYKSFCKLYGVTGYRGKRNNNIFILRNGKTGNPWGFLGDILCLLVYRQ